MMPGRYFKLKQASPPFIEGRPVTGREFEQVVEGLQPQFVGVYPRAAQLQRNRAADQGMPRGPLRLRSRSVPIVPQSLQRLEGGAARYRLTC